MYFWRKYPIPCFYHYAGETLTLSLSCWQSCREMVKNTSVSLSQGTTHSTLWTWLTSNRLLLSSLWRRPQEEIKRGTILYSGIIFLHHVFMNAGIVHLAWLYKLYIKDRKKKRKLTTLLPGCAKRSFQLAWNSRKSDKHKFDSHTGLFRVAAKCLWRITSSNLCGVGGQHVKLVYRQAQFAQVDVEIHHHVPRHRRREHFLKVERHGEVFFYSCLAQYFLHKANTVNTRTMHPHFLLSEPFAFQL